MNVETDQAMLVDEARIAQLVEDTSAEILPELLRFYITDTRERIDVIRSARAEGDLDKLEFETHTVGSSAGAHANQQLHLVARKIEALCQEDQHDAALVLTDELLEIAEQSLRSLDARIEQGFA